MKFKKMLGAVAAAAALASGAAQAAPVSVGGVTFNPSALVDFVAQSNLYENVALNAGDKIQGYGQITALNGLTNFCASASCELTFVFSGFTLQNDITGEKFKPFAFSGGFLDVYVSSMDYDFAVPATAANGTLWLSLAAKAGLFAGEDGANSNTTLYGGTTSASAVGALVAGEGSGFFDVTGGLAQAYFDTNGQLDGTDFLFTSNFSPTTNPITDPVTGFVYTHAGGATITGDSRAVPEPGALALLGLGIAAVGVARRNKKQV
jgi:hypothetical protein